MWNNSKTLQKEIASYKNYFLPTVPPPDNFARSKLSRKDDIVNAANSLTNQMKVIIDKIGENKQNEGNRQSIYRELLRREFSKISDEHVAEAFVECQKALKLLKSNGSHYSN